MPSGLVTIGIPTYNRSHLLLRAVRSALAQSYQPIEIVISDDASTDNTALRIKELDDPRIKFLQSRTNAGIAGNSNKCLEHASGDLLLMLNDDDELEPMAIERLSEPFRRPVHGIPSEKVGVTWCPCVVQTQERQIKWVTQAGPPVETGVDLVLGLFDGTRGPRFCGVMIHAADARAVGGYSLKHGPIPDVGSWTQVALRREWAICVPDALARYTAHSSSCTGSSTPRSWQRAGENIFADLAAYLENYGDGASLRRLRSARRNFISGLLATVIMQGIGQPGWATLAMRELVRAPQYFFTPMVFRRLLRDRSKLLRKTAGDGASQDLPQHPVAEWRRSSKPKPGF